MNCGQTCIATNHIFVPKSMSKDLIQKLKEMMKEYYGEDSQINDNYGRIINQNQAKNLNAMLEEVEDDVIYQ